MDENVPSSSAQTDSMAELEEQNDLDSKARLFNFYSP